MNSSAPTGLWDPQSPFNYASPLPRTPAPSTTSSTSITSTPGLPRRTHVTSATPAKRITFYKSGDNQFGGIRMAIHGRSFKCFDALLDDLSQKVPLPFGVRTVTTPRGTRNIKHLEQLQDRGCYLCSDRRQAKPVNMELAGKRPVIWQYQGRRPWAPCMGPPPSHSVLRQRRILLVKNSEPGLRRSTVLSRRNTRSLKAFMDDVSEVMQFHVRKLYTVEGRKIDSVQSLMTCPSVLVCAGREAFSATLLDCARKNSEEKLPGLGTRTPGNGARSPATLVSRSPPNGARSTPRVARSRASDGSEGSKKSVNFGLETKKSVIHRRSDSSNHSARFSVSSDTEKQGVGCHHQARTAFGNDDIEKRVLVNKDGSLSVEMKVRFRLHNEETVQWSTQIRKSPPASLSSDGYPLKEDQPCYLQQGQSQSCSDPDSASASCDPGVTDYISQSLRHPLEENHCPCCCQRCQQQYDLWENPAHSHKHPVAPPLHASRHTHSSSSSSSCRSRRVIRRHTRLSDSGSEQGRVVQEEVCVMEEVQRKVEQSGDCCVEVCRISRCSSRSEVEVEGNLCPHSRTSVEDSGTVDGEERPPSAISNSSHVLQALQEDDDDEEEENLPSSASQCCSSREPAAQTHLIPRPPSKGSISSAHSAVHSKTPQCEEDGRKGNSADEMDRATSSRSQTSRTSHRSTIVRTLNPEEEGAADDEAEPRVLSSLSSLAGSAQSRSSSVCPDCGGCKRGSTPASCASQAGESCSRASHRSHHSHHSHHSHTATANPPAPNEEAECVASGESDDSDGSVSSMGSNRSNLTHQECFSALSNIPEGRPSSTMSHASNRSKHSPTPLGEPPAESAGPEEEERAQSTTSAASHRSGRSHKSNCSEATAAPDAEASGRGTEGEQEGENVAERAASAVSAKSNTSAGPEEEERAQSTTSAASHRSRRSHKSNCSEATAAPDAEASGRGTEGEQEGENVAERAASAVSAKSNTSAGPEEEERAQSTTSAASHRSRRSHKSNCSEATAAPDAEASGRGTEGEQEGENVAERAASAVSAKSNASAGLEEEERAQSTTSAASHRSRRSHKSNCSEVTAAPDAEASGRGTEGEQEGENVAERAASAVSAKSNASARTGVSAKSAESHKSNGDASARAVTPAANPADVEADTNDTKDEVRASSVLSTKSAKSDKSAASKVSRVSHKSCCSHCGKAVSPCPNGADNAKGAEAMDRDEEQKREEEEEVMDGRAASAMSNLSAKSCKSHKSSKALARSHSPTSEAADDGAERAASAMTARSTKSNISVRSAKSCMSDYNGSSKEKVKEEVGEEAEEKSAIATSRKSSHSGGVSLDSETGGEKGEGEEMEVGDKTEGGDENVERAASAISVKSARSNLSAKSSKSTCKHTEIPTIETNGAEGGTDEVGETSDERAASAMSAKSKLSVKSSRSHKSDGKGGKPEGGEEKLEERSVSAMSAKSMKSNVSAAKSHQSGCDVSPAEVPVIETTDADDEGKAVKERTPSSASTKSTSAVNARPTGDGGSVRSKSVLSVASASARSPSPRKTPAPQPPSRQEQSIPKAAAPSPSTPQTPKRQLLPGSEAGVRGSSALSVRSAASTRSNRSKCHCGASSALQKMEKEEEEELENEGEKATERAASVLSASLGIERPLSGASSGSVSLGLPEDREHESINWDSRSHISSHTARSNRSATPSKVKPVDIPTIETTGGNEEAKEGEMPEVERSASALSAKSNASAKSSRSQKSTSIYSNVGSPKLIRGTKGQNSTSPTKTENGKSTIYLNTPDNRTPSAMSSSSNKVRIKSPTRASPKPTTPVPGDSAVENISTIKPLSPSEGKEDMTDENAPSVSKSPNCLRPQSAAASSLRPKSAVATDDSYSNESTLSKSLSAADLLKETIAAGRPLSRQSKGSEKSGASRRSEKRKEADLTPACLPNASLNEVVSDWLKNIPTNGCMFALGDELSDGGQEGKETEGGHGEKVEKEVEEAEVEKVEEEEETGDDVVEEEKSDAALPTTDITSSHPAALFEGKDLLHKNCHSSVAVMKVLLSPIRGRCRSLPEVSPVYGRRLSTSAQGLLDCLAQLQLIEPGSGSDSEQPKDRNQRYCEIITLLQSLWLSKPKDKEAGQEQVSPPRSSSGVGMSSGSGGSGNNGIDGGDGTLLKTTDNEAVSTHVADAGEGETEAGDTGEEKPTVDEGTKGGEELTAKLPELPTEEVMDSPKSSGAPSPSDKSSNGDSPKSQNDTERESPNDSNVDSPSAVLEVPLSKQPSQDPDPVWVLRLLKKLEKQFMNHYTDAMTEFKVRWDLDDSLMLNTMIKELREEVSQRIQRSIGRELKKIQGRAGKAPRPPTEAHLSRESTMTDRRRQMLKVMKNQSLKTADSLSDDEMTGEYSDPRSDDDYCPCDACVKKKMEARPPKMHPAANAAPVMMAFDLRKILQQKKAPEPPPAANAAPVMMAFDLRKILERKKAPEPPPPPPPALSPEPADGNGVNGDVQEEGNNLEVVQEEDEDEDEEGEEETKDIIVPNVILEETIPEEDEEEEEGEDEKEETQREEVEEEKEGETGEEEEEEGVENAEEKGGERAEETCECQHPHETEGEAGEEEGENDDGEQEKEEEEEEAAREEQSEDAVENEEESTPEGNTGAEAEDDDGEGEKGTTDEDESGGETASTQRKEQGGVAVVCVTEGEEADGEDSDMGSKRPSEAGADQSGCDGTAEDEGEKEAAGEGESEDVVENIVEEGKQVNGLFHQYTRTSVESQPGSMEAIDTEPSRTVSPLHPKKSQETGTKMVTGVSRGEGVAGKGQRRSRSPARVKRRKPNGSDRQLDDLEI